MAASSELYGTRSKGASGFEVVVGRSLEHGRRDWLSASRRTCLLIRRSTSLFIDQNTNTNAHITHSDM